MISKRLRLLVPLALAAVAAACSSTDGGVSPSAKPSPLPTGTIRITTSAGIVELEVQIAETTEARRRGLMGVRNLEPDAGMAFLFPEPVDPGFWMKGTLIPLAIAFWNSDGRIVDIQEMTPCRNDPCPFHSPGAPVVGAVEANRGFFEANGVRPGDPVELVRDG
jgi:uncharacterized membrane protein (UPF0127 family)